jgi:hypothetical protein
MLRSTAVVALTMQAHGAAVLCAMQMPSVMLRDASVMLPEASVMRRDASVMP